ncbi:MAG: Lrp/AsnC family transcriptional regulator [Bacteroidia bacterium]|nr:Lrp/AsnC family transcriptional regulator [Bacteroidia bacterium]MDW8235529.1 Lrp/AsnC family transcriptional regulator [Bacteroidia bacterium]
MRDSIYSENTNRMKKRRENMDQLDYKLLSVLAEDPTRSYSKVKERLGISMGTIYLRRQRLQEWGVIRGAQLILDPQKLGYAFSISVRMRVPDIQKSIELLKQRSEVSSAYVLVGDRNLLVHAYARSMNDVQELLQYFSRELRAEQIDYQVVLDAPLSRGVPIPGVAEESSSRKRASSRSTKSTSSSKSSSKGSRK